ncbi:MAG: DUF1015 domain-containing protein [Oscillospiraceae bacterium]|jgi:hypothetical protein|nr:DUF1015 domain-containing protein [Oscillospiraceae bacterium]
MKDIFVPGDILIPKDADMTLWSVIACDQFTSSPEYWDGLDARIGKAPSTLRLMLPEAYLETRDSAQETVKINRTMEEYLEQGVFETVADSFVYVERDMTVGEKRRGILGLLDLDAYDYRHDSKTPVRCTEGTVESRLPPRVKVRKDAALELPHVVVFTDDPAWTMFKGLEAGDVLYDFDLMDGGGHIIGRRVTGEAARGVMDALLALSEPEYLEKKYALGGLEPVIIAMGDGNHSLATAKLCWETIKPTLTEAERANSPARYALVELVNIHDKSIEFEPIHRVIFETEVSGFFSEAEAFFAAKAGDGAGEHKITLLCGQERREAILKGRTIGEAIALAQEFCVDYVNLKGGKLDYIHDDDTAIEMSSQPGCCGLLLPSPGKDELFSSIIRSGAFPAKSFSIGPARDKRYYLECRKIK